MHCAERHLNVSWKLFPHVFPCGYELRALLDQSVRTPGTLVCHIARNSIYVAVLFEGATRGDARPAVFRGFDDQHPDRHAADDPVANREILRRRRGADRKLANERAA